MFNVNPSSLVGRMLWDGEDQQDRITNLSGPVTRRPVGSSLSANSGIGVGAVIDNTWDDAQWRIVQGRHIGHAWDEGNQEMTVHFTYIDQTDTANATFNSMSGYNNYRTSQSTTQGWLNGPGEGCELQESDTTGYGGIADLDVMSNGLVVMGARGHFTGDDGANATPARFYFQVDPTSCFYTPDDNTTAVDPTSEFLNPSGPVSIPQVVTQWDGTQDITHILMMEYAGTAMSGPNWADDEYYRVCVYFRKVGSDAGSGSWSAGVAIDTMWYIAPSLVAAPYPYEGVAVTYTNTSYWGTMLNMGYDLDVFCRESSDRGLSWGDSYSITNYQNAIHDDPNHFTAWLETQALYASDGDLHAIWTAKPTSADPYFDGYHWMDFHQNVYHWAKSTDEIVEVADGTYIDDDMLSNNVNTLHCGFGGYNAGYIASINLSECDNKLFCVWNQMHERANRFEWRGVEPQPAEGVLDDCSYDGNRLARANWEILMSVAWLASSSSWDEARNITNTYTPNCGLPDDPSAQGPCGSEYKPTVEKYGFDETGLSLTWPSEAVVDMTPEYLAPYSGNSWLNMHYHDDQYPGPYSWGSAANRANPPGTTNSQKWVRLACVDPVEASLISVLPGSIQWPTWAEIGQTTSFTVAVTNDGNLPLSVTSISTSPTGTWLSASLSGFTVGTAPSNSAMFDIQIDATGLVGSQWLDGEVTIESDAANQNPVNIPIHILTADHVEDIRYDTVQSHEDMFNPFFDPAGQCVALAVGNHGEIGLAAEGQVNLDFVESGYECGTRERDAIYLVSGSPYVINADAFGTNASLTTSYAKTGFAADHTFQPYAPFGTMSSGMASSGDYDSVYSGGFVTRDTTVALERTFYAPRDNDNENSFVVVVTKVYSADGQTHDNVSIGSVSDWDIPSDSVTMNTAGYPTAAAFVYARGTDTVGSISCQQNANRFATEAFITQYTHDDLQADPCYDNTVRFGNFAYHQELIEDTNLARDGTTPIAPPQPDGQAWWDEIDGHPGTYGESSPQDLAVFLSYAHNVVLSALDTLYYVSAYTSVLNGTESDLENQVDYAHDWYWDHFRVPGCLTSGYCGDVNLTAQTSGYNFSCLSIGDISALIDHLYLTRDPLQNEYVADCDGVPGIDNADIMALNYAVFVVLNDDLLNCEPPVDTFHIGSDDALRFVGTEVPPDVTSWTVELWLTPIDDYAGLSVLFQYDFPSGNIVLESIEFDPDGILVPYSASFIGNKNAAPQSGAAAVMRLGDVQIPAIEFKLADLRFTVDAQSVPTEIIIDTTSFDPGGTTVLTRNQPFGPGSYRPVVVIEAQIPDLDSDGVPNGTDNCLYIYNPDQTNSDADRFGDLCDNCTAIDNVDQLDADADGIGDVCDACTDIDGDGYGDPGYALNACLADNCPEYANPGQEDLNGNGIGDICEFEENYAIIFDSVSNKRPDGTLMAGMRHRIYLHYRNISTNWLLGSNAWEMYSPDGADWSYLHSERGPLCLFEPEGGPLNLATSIFLNNYFKSAGSGTFVKMADLGSLPQYTGTHNPDSAGGNVSGNDTVGVVLACITNQIPGGWPQYADELGLIVEFQSRLQDVGRHICFDTTSKIVQWEWLAQGEPTTFPPYWSGDICLEIGSCEGPPDGDGDNITDICDNCPDSFNPGQEDVDGDGIGDVCDVPKIWYVEADGSGSAPTIQAAIDSASNSDTVMVAAGTYTGDGNRDIDFLGKAIVVIGQNQMPATTIIDCEADSLNPHRGFIFQNREDSNSVLSGFTIKNGFVLVEGVVPWPVGGGILCYKSSPIIENCHLESNRAGGQDGTGGGMSCEDSCAAIIRDCSFIGNSASFGGALDFSDYCIGARVEQCRFDSNTAISIYEGGWSSGGAIQIYGLSNVQFYNCDLTNNTADGNGHGVAYGGAVICYGATLKMYDCVLRSNRASGGTIQAFGGAVFAVGGGVDTALFEGCEFVDNAVESAAGGVFRGGAIYSYNMGWMNYETCLFSENHCPEYGGAVYDFASAVLNMDMCTLYGNGADSSGSALALSDNNATISGCILAFNNAGEPVYCFPDEKSPQIATASSAPLAPNNRINLMSAVWEEDNSRRSSAADAALEAQAVGLDIICTNVYGNSAGDWVGCIADMDTVVNNMSLNPIFCDTASEDFHLDSLSPCAAGSPANLCGHYLGAFAAACQNCLDGDHDGICSEADNCPAIYNPSQADGDEDGSGDACDLCTDTDRDGYGNPGFVANTCAEDNCPSGYNPSQADADGDGVGDRCDPCTDTDGDGYGDPGYVANTCPLDNCPDTYNLDQTDQDNDGKGNPCDAGQVLFTGFPRCGLPPLTVAFTDTSYIHDGDPVDYFWEFGDGGTSEEQHPSHEYTGEGSFDVMLIISDGVNLDTLVENDYVVIQDVITADFTASPVTGQPPLAVAFDPVLTGVANSYTWDFGDGNGSNDPNPIYTYTSEGIFDVSLTVELDLDGCVHSDTDTKTHFVTVRELDARFMGTPRAGTYPLSVQFFDQSPGNPDSWYWDFGDGQTSYSQDPNHVYSEAGSYDVSLNVNNGIFVDSLRKADYITVDTSYADLIGLLIYFGNRPGFEFEYYCFWGNTGTATAENCSLLVVLPEDIEDFQIGDVYDAGNGGTGTYTGFSQYGDTVIIPLETIDAVGPESGYIQIRGRLPEWVPIGDSITYQFCLSTTTPESDTDSNCVWVRDEVIGSIDPNDKSALPKGKGTDKSIDHDQKLSYLVQFENKPEATAEAIYVLVVDTLDPNLNWATLEMGPMSHPETCTWGFDMAHGVITWFCDHIMLPPNLNPPEGEGYFTYSVAPLPDLPEGTRIENTAWIRFDYNPWLMAPEAGPVVRTISYGCCLGHVGDANGSGDDAPTIGDISTMIDAKFISGSCEGKIACLAEADINQSGGGEATCDDITIGDISMLIDYLFITGPETFGPLPYCP
jgi:PKD repeat protein